MYVALPSITETLEELESLLKRERNPHLRPRLHLLILLQSAQVESRQEAAAHLAVHRNTVGRWLGAYASGGLAALRCYGHASGQSGQRSLPSAAWQALKDRLQGVGFSSYGEAQDWLREEWGQTIPYSTLHGWIHYRLGAKLKRSRPRHEKQRLRSAQPFLRA